MTVLVRIMHVSMQFTDSAEQHAHDAKAIFAKAQAEGVLFVAGTESFAFLDALTHEAGAHGFTINAHPTGDWVAANRKLGRITSKGYAGPFIPSSPTNHARGIPWITVKVPEAGLLTHGVAHYLAEPVPPAANQPLVDGIAAWGRGKGKGKRIVFFSADANERDNLVDVFRGHPFTTIGDELGFHPKTHGKDTEHGSAIDIVASYDLDVRSRAKSYVVLDDSELYLFTDHFALIAAYTVQRQ